MRARVSLPLLLLATACAPPEAPTALNDLSRYLYREWEDPDPAVREAGVQNLAEFLADFDLASNNVDDRAWTLDVLEPDDVVDLPARPDRPLSDALAVGVAHWSPWPIEDHARLQTESDQLPTEPSATRYVREFPGLDDPSCYPDGNCEILPTRNDARRENLLLAADFILFKTFRWVAWETDDGEPRRAFYSRSWFEESWPGDKENVVLWQSYSLDVWIDRGDEGTWRYQTLWSETDLGFAVNDGTVIGTIKVGTAGAFDAGDEAIGELYHDGEEPPAVGDQ